MDGMYKIKIFQWNLKIAYDLWKSEFQCV